MTIELARAVAMHKPWGVADPGPWIKIDDDGALIGEVWYDRPDKPGKPPSLLLKLLFTGQPLSIQVHPDDDYAKSIGLANGKTEAWCVLSAAPGAKVALGLQQPGTEQKLREAAADGSIAELVAWQTVSADDVLLVPAGTIHAIGAGLVIAEIQQRCDATFRLFDHGRARELHIENAVAVADLEPAKFQVQPNRLNDQRSLLVSNPHFILERIDLAPGSTWRLEAERETWLLVLSGGATAGSFEIAIGDALFAQSDHVDVRVGEAGVDCLVAYTGVGGPVPHLLHCQSQIGSTDGRRREDVQLPPALARAGRATASPRAGAVQ